VPLWLERYILPICATIVFGALILNPFKIDWQQRVSLFVAVSAFAYFLAHTIHKPKATATAESEQRIGFLERQVETIQSQQKQFANEQAEEDKKKQQRQIIRGQLALFLKKGREIQERIHYNDPDSLRQKVQWENQVEIYLAKNLDEPYAIRFRTPAHQVTSYPMGMNQLMLGSWGDIGAKMAMLNDFISELRD
jgi:hypothetical protein